MLATVLICTGSESIMDAIVSAFYEVYFFLARLWDIYEGMVTQQLPYMRELTTSKSGRVESVFESPD